MENQEEKGLSIVELLQLLLKNWLIIGLSTVLIASIAAIYAFVIATPMYESKSDIIVQVESSSSELGYDYTTALRLVPSIAEFMKKDIVLDHVIETLNLETKLSAKQIREGLSVTASNTTFFVYVTYTSPDPDLARQVADQIVESAREIANTNATFSSFKDKISEPTTIAKTGVQTSPNKPLLLIIGVLLGGILGVGIVLVVELTNNTYRTKEELEADFGIQVIGVIPSFEVKEEF
ncbi:Wzz/FepE/Etk N-terminal domain-containing protein [Acholeplasma vituli]|uniref:Wzz/FepE/Etk N-terminal domain-containing protein n=1 Tax=Paracholeplasma vituli TaxID=69473 RepID=A0ABT2PVM5_9MOLU|nr:Wzz/FepE/Etk N-terminal domain-containing protein [Paracholeplasma vituli]MCU0104389.1 Wzz/FepE/Etk N-terminal domain-containing protein [Paracholeplasma vituli]